jgi:hypothetical protein
MRQLSSQIVRRFAYLAGPKQNHIFHNESGPELQDHSTNVLCQDGPVQRLKTLTFNIIPLIVS